MDKCLIDYLLSGEAWVLVGSGPSIQMGYPTWGELASVAIALVKREVPRENISKLEKAFEQKNYPLVFEHAASVQGMPRLLEYLLAHLRPKDTSTIYELITGWPVPIYMTTNYDNEIQSHLAQIGEPYLSYNNSADHMASLLPDFSGSIFKLHGDLRSASGLILTSSQYRDIESSPNWQYWRTKMISVFQMQKIIVIGHSLTDTNIRHVLSAAKQGAGVYNPICWLAPDVPFSKVQEYLNDYRIRVIPYDNKSGDHRNLVRLIEDISTFIPPRTQIEKRDQIAKIDALGSNAAAPGFFIFSKLYTQQNFEEKRIETLIAALQAVIPKLDQLDEFSLQTALEYAGWPKNLNVDTDFARQLTLEAVKQQLVIVKQNGLLQVAPSALTQSAENKRRFEHMRERFKQSTILRLRRKYPTLNSEQAERIAIDLEQSLTGFFQEGGLSLATTLLKNGRNTSNKVIPPPSIIQFITDASTRYDNILMRRAFCSIALDAFVNAESGEREYLGRVSQGFAAFHLLGVYGDAAAERFAQASKTVWLIDSNVHCCKDEKKQVNRRDEDTKHK